MENKQSVRIVFSNLEDFTERCKKKAVPTIYFTVRENMREDKRIVVSVEITAMDYTEPANLVFFENRTSQPITLQEEYDQFKKDFNLRIYGGEVEVMQNGKQEIVKVAGIIPFIQGEYAGGEIKAGWIGY